MRAGKAGQGCAKWGKSRQEWARAVRQEWVGSGVSQQKIAVSGRCFIARNFSWKQKFMILYILVISSYRNNREYLSYYYKGILFVVPWSYLCTQDRLMLSEIVQNSPR